MAGWRWSNTNDNLCFSHSSGRFGRGFHALYVAGDIRLQALAKPI
jgi:hypothetical protein